MYITNFDRLFDSVWNEPLVRDAVLNERRKTSFGAFDVDVLEDGKQKVTIDTIGHNPKDYSWCNWRRNYNQSKEGRGHISFR